MLLWGELYRYNKFKLWEHPLYKNREYAFKAKSISKFLIIIYPNKSQTFYYKVYKIKFFFLIQYKHLKNSNAACFYTPIVLQLLITDQMRKQPWRRKLNHNNFDTSFVTIYQVLIILWRLKGEKYPFPLLQYIVLTNWLARYDGGWFEPSITSCADFLT